MNSASGPHEVCATPVLTVIGDAVTNIVVWPEGPVWPGTDNPSRIVAARGGSAANVAVAAASVAEGRFVSRFIGQIGSDPAGDHLVRVLKAAGVDTCVQRDGISARVVMIVDAEGARTMYPDPGSAAHLAVIPPHWMECTRILHVPLSGLLHEPMRSTVLYAISAAQSVGVQISLDLSSVATIEQLGAQEVRHLLHQIGPHVVFAGCAEAEAVRLDEDPHPSVGLHVITAGSHPAHVGAWVPDLVKHDFIVEWTEVPARELDDVHDTTGAGDRFAAGFLAARMTGADPVEAAHAGHDLAARGLGARASAYSESADLD